MGCLKRKWKLEDTSEIQEELNERAGKENISAGLFYSYVGLSRPLDLMQSRLWRFRQRPVKELQLAQRKIKITNVRNIKKLEFDIPNKGVYVLTGPNGSGKTTLLASLYRIGYWNAFADNFKTTIKEQKLDSFGGACITYSVGTDEVFYKYSNTRWSPTPRKNSKLLSRMGFPAVKFIAANAKRIEPTADELKTNIIRKASDQIIQDVKSILSDKKFDNLKIINTKRGVGHHAYLIEKKISGKNYYFSEKNFSLGELCVLKLVHEIKDIPHNSMILIDEIEMALHPRAQASLFHYLLKKSDEKNLTIIFSTHSASLIKRAGKRHILLLRDNGEGDISCFQRCYPAQALGDISFDEDIQPDYLFFVEDYQAKFLLEQMLEAYKVGKEIGSPSPYYKVVPVGGFPQVVEFLINSDQIFSDSVKRFAYLDKDVQDEAIKQAEDNKNYALLEKFKNNKEKIKYLPCTPERGIIELISADKIEHSRQMKTKFAGGSIDLEMIMRSDDYNRIQSDKPRELTKKQFSYITSEISRKTGMSEESVDQIFATHYVKCEYSTNAAALNAEFGPIFSKL